MSSTVAARDVAVASCRRGTWRSFGGTEFAPNAGLATREEQIIVAERIYAKYGFDSWGCANNVLHWPQWSM